MITSTTSSRSARIDPAPPAGINALILDDNQFDRMKIRRLFKSSGMPVHLDDADTVQSMQDVLDSQEFDVILLDYNLPQANGIDALKLVRDHPVNGHAATIMITGDDRSDVAVESLKEGCLDYITKGELSADRLRECVMSAIEEAERTRKAEDKLAEHARKVTQSIMSEYSAALQPELAKIVRELRRLRASMGDPDSNFPADLEEIERRCIRLWAALTSPQELGLSPEALARIG